jgi:hypothetical protein
MTTNPRTVHPTSDKGAGDADHEGEQRPEEEQEVTTRPPDETTTHAPAASSEAGTDAPRSKRSARSAKGGGGGGDDTSRSQRNMTFSQKNGRGVLKPQSSFSGIKLGTESGGDGAKRLTFADDHGEVLVVVRASACTVCIAHDTSFAGHHSLPFLRHPSFFHCHTLTRVSLPIAPSLPPSLTPRRRTCSSTSYITAQTPP